MRAARPIRRSPLGFSEELWRQYAELGLLGAPFAEDDGGYGGGAVETMLVEEAFGRALALEPYLATVVLCGGVLRHGASRRAARGVDPRDRGRRIADFARARRARRRAGICLTSRRARARTARAMC